MSTPWVLDALWHLSIPSPRWVLTVSGTLLQVPTSAPTTNLNPGTEPGSPPARRPYRNLPFIDPGSSVGAHWDALTRPTVRSDHESQGPILEPSPDPRLPVGRIAARGIPSPRLAPYRLVPVSTPRRVDRWERE
jgi:hypothetical protein